MKINELVRYDIPPEILALWRESESDILLPLQELAVKRHDLFGDGNLLIQAPTSSGKTFIGEMAALRAALHRKKVVYLVPLKALAEEKYHAFREKYAPYGLRVIVSTRDRREFDRDLENGTFSIAVVVYEKLSQLLVRRPERIEEMGPHHCGRAGNSVRYGPRPGNRASADAYLGRAPPADWIIGGARRGKTAGRMVEGRPALLRAAARGTALRRPLRRRIHIPHVQRL